jgi:hypothetical protein
MANQGQLGAEWAFKIKNTNIQSGFNLPCWLSQFPNAGFHRTTNKINIKTKKADLKSDLSSVLRVGVTRDEREEGQGQDPQGLP